MSKKITCLPLAVVLYGMTMMCSQLIAVDGFSIVSISSRRSKTMAMTRLSTLQASKHLVEIVDSNFRDLFRAEQPLLVDCCAPWCGPCRLIEPVLDECAQKWKDTVVIGKYDVESGNDEVKVELLLKGVMPQSLPALILVHKNKVLATHKGIIRLVELEAMLEEHVYGKVKELAGVAASSNKAPRQKSGLISFAAVGGGGDDYMLRQI